MVNGWALEVVRGRDVGRRYALGVPDLVLGNAPGGEPGIDLAEQEAAGSPRRMAGKQARLVMGSGRLTIADLESPGGTFVNRQRVLPGVARPLQPGDLIQLAGVQLRVVAGGGTTAEAPPPAKPRESGTIYRLPSGTVCRVWDDFLVVASQRWGELREELTSGRLASGLVASGHSSKAPRADAPGTPDERLDAWLGSLPTTRPARPELDVHPTRLTVRASGGGTTRRTMRIGNTGFRLLHSTIRVEPPGTSWLRVATEHSGRPVVTVESSEVSVEIDLPERLESPRSAALVVESDGGTARVKVVIEPARADQSIEPATSEATADWGLGAWLARRSLASRVEWIVAALIALRLMVALGGGIWSSDSADASPGLAGPAVALAGIGVALGLAFGFRYGEPRDRPACGFAGAIAGLMTAAVSVALARTVEAPLGGMPVGLVAWIVLGVALAGLSWWLVPETHAGKGAS